MRFVFVHGTGVRRERHDALFGLVRERLADRFPGAEVDSCFWGERFGAEPGAGSRSLPGAGGGADGGEEAAEWGLLLADPLCELRVLAEAGWGPGEGEAGGGDPFAMPGVRPAGERVLELLHRLAEAPEDGQGPDELGALLRGTGLAAGYRPALEAAARSAE
ncbi:hypothetical protein AB0D45_24480, partial [Streptomyces sp. NPDC048352]